MDNVTYFEHLEIGPIIELSKGTVPSGHYIYMAPPPTELILEEDITSVLLETVHGEVWRDWSTLGRHQGRETGWHAHLPDVWAGAII